MPYAIIERRTWDEVQGSVWLFALGGEYEVTPGCYISQDEARGIGRLNVYMRDGMIPLASFRPFLRRDGETLKQINVEYFPGRDTDLLLEGLGVRLVDSL